MAKGNLRRAAWIVALPACLLMAEIGLAHPGHHDGLTTKQAVIRGKAIVRSLVENGETVNGELLDESWNNIDGHANCAATPEYYLISLENRSKGKTVHLLLDRGGKFLHARFDESFDELDSSSFPLPGCDQR